MKKLTVKDMENAWYTLSIKLSMINDLQEVFNIIKEESLKDYSHEWEINDGPSSEDGSITYSCGCDKNKACGDMFIFFSPEEDMMLICENGSKSKDVLKRIHKRIPQMKRSFGCMWCDDGSTYGDIRCIEHGFYRIKDDENGPIETICTQHQRRGNMLFNNLSEAYDIEILEEYVPSFGE